MPEAAERSSLEHRLQAREWMVMELRSCGRKPSAAATQLVTNLYSTLEANAPS